MIKKLALLITEGRPPSGPMVVGVTGMDTSGKSTMTTLLAEELVSSGLSVQVIRLDDFHRSRADRHPADVSEPDQYFEHGFDFERLRDELLKPIRDEGQVEKTLMCLDLMADTWTLERKYMVASDTIVLLAGVFLFRPDIAHFLDLIIYLAVDEATVNERALTRDVAIHGDEILERYQTKYLPAQRAYLEEYPPEINADVIIDNNDWMNPVAIKWPQ